MNAPTTPGYDGTMKILVAEDDFLSRKIVFRALQELGECDLACNGAEAWAAFRAAHQQKEPYGLVMLDIMMPELEGVEVLGRMRAFEESMGLFGTSRARIVMATAHFDTASVMNSFNGQCDGFIKKPYTPHSIRNHLRKLGVLSLEEAARRA